MSILFLCLHRILFCKGVAYTPLLYFASNIHKGFTAKHGELLNDHTYLFDLHIVEMRIARASESEVDRKKYKSLPRVLHASAMSPLCSILLNQHVTLSYG